jgi:arylsulfatase A-like enzyme
MAFLITVMVASPALRSTTYAQTPDKKPNFLVIVGDDFGYSDIGAFGSEISTPNLDMLAHDGKILTNYHTAPTCSPARVSLLTGVDYHIAGIGTMFENIAENQIGKPGYETYINDRVVTVAELLKDAGYHTYLSGKWHLSGQSSHNGSAPYDRGFEKSLTLLGDGANHFNDKEYVPGWPVIFQENDKIIPRPENGTYETELFADRLIDYMKSNEGDGKPFFSYLAFQVAHTPFQAPPEFVDKYDKIYSAGWEKIREQRFEKQKELGFWPSNMTLPKRIPVNQAWDSLTKDQQSYAARVLAVHAAMIEEMDKNIGKVIQYLKDSGQYDNTFILFTSDNGTSEPVEMADFRFMSGVDLESAKANYHLVNNSLANLGNPTSDFNYGPWGQIVAASPYSGYKGFFYEGGITVPLLIKGPKSTLSSGNASGTNIVKSYVRVLDITPTILELANVSHPSTYNGRDVSPMIGKSLTGLLEGKVDKVYQTDEPLAAELFNNTVVRMGDWMVIHNQYDKDGVWNLYNLANDIGQNTNLAEQHPDIVQKLKAVYEKYAKEVGVIIPRGKAFANAVAGATETGRIAADTNMTINLADMFAPGYPLELNPVAPLK